MHMLVMKVQSSLYSNLRTFLVHVQNQRILHNKLMNKDGPDRTACIHRSVCAFNVCMRHVGLVWGRSGSQELYFLV